VRDVRALHEVVAVADRRRRAGDRSPVHSDVLAEDVVVADLEEGLDAAEGEILRLAAQDRAGVDDVTRAEARPAAQYRMRQDLRLGADTHGVLDHHVGTDRGGRVDLGFGADDRSRIDHAEPSSVGSSSSGHSGASAGPAMRYSSVTHPPRSLS